MAVIRCNVVSVYEVGPLSVGCCRALDWSNCPGVWTFVCPNNKFYTTYDFWRRYLACWFTL